MASPASIAERLSSHAAAGPSGSGKCHINAQRHSICRRKPVHARTQRPLPPATPALFFLSADARSALTGRTLHVNIRQLHRQPRSSPKQEVSFRQGFCESCELGLQTCRHRRAGSMHTNQSDLPCAAAGAGGGSEHRRAAAARMDACQTACRAHHLPGPAGHRLLGE